MNLRPYINTSKLIHSLKSRQDALEADMTKLSKRFDKSLKDTETEFNKVKAAILDMETTLSNYKDKPIMAEITSLIECKIKSCKDEIIEETKKEIPLACSDIVSKTVDSKLDKVSTDNPSWAAAVSKQVDSKFAKVSTDVNRVHEALTATKVHALEEKEKELRCNNIIIYRVPEGQETKEERAKLDRTFCQNLIKNALDIDFQDEDLKKIFRLGKKDTNSRPLLIQLRDKSVKNSIMESLYKLKQADDAYKNVSITHDLTKKEREDCKALVEEAKKKQASEQGEWLWRVRGLPGMMKIIRIQKK